MLDSIQRFCANTARDHHRYRSWEHCFRYFHTASQEAIRADRDHAALQLGFYLASWGMYRASGFLLQHIYTIYLACIDCILESRFALLWNEEFGAGRKDGEILPVILDAMDAIRTVYEPFSASPTLVTKIMLGTFGCVPAFDRFFIDGFKNAGFTYTRSSRVLLETILRFCLDNSVELSAEQNRISQLAGMKYPLMKLVDMYFWQVGYELQ